MLKHFNYKIETVSSVQLSLFEIKARIVNCLSLKALYYVSLRKFERVAFFVGPLQRVRPRNGILALGLVVLVLVLVLVLVFPLRSAFIGEL